jgi:hypothetical protein
MRQPCTPQRAGEKNGHLNDQVPTSARLVRPNSRIWALESGDSIPPTFRLKRPTFQRLS